MDVYGWGLCWRCVCCWPGARKGNHLPARKPASQPRSRDMRPFRSRRIPGSEVVKTVFAQFGKVYLPASYGSLSAVGISALRRSI